MALSAEVRLLILYMQESGTSHRVTSTTDGQHAPYSYHYREGTDGQGLAVDFAGPVPSVNSPALLAVYQALEPLGRFSAELIYNGPGGGSWKNGKKVAPYAGGHRDHVHIAVPKGTFVHHEKETNAVTVYQVNAPVVAFQATHTGLGYWVVCADGGIFAFGDAAALVGLGRVEYTLPAGNDWTPSA